MNTSGLRVRSFTLVILALALALGFVTQRVGAVTPAVTPVASNDAYTTASDAPITPLMVPAPGLLTNVELALVSWTDEEKAAFIEMQFQAQSIHYAKYYPNADFRVIERDGIPVGRLYLDRGARDIRIVDITLLPEARGTGIGTRLLQEILAEGAQTGKTVSIHVEQYNPALRLYQRLGFTQVNTHGVYYLMQWSPPTMGSDQPKTAS